MSDTDLLQDALGGAEWKGEYTQIVTPRDTYCCLELREYVIQRPLIARLDHIHLLGGRRNESGSVVWSPNPDTLP